MKIVEWNQQVHMFTIVNGQMWHDWRDRRNGTLSSEPLTQLHALDQTQEPDVMVMGPDAGSQPALPSQIQVGAATAGGGRINWWQDDQSDQWGQSVVGGPSAV